MFSKGSVLVVDDEVNLCRILGAKLARSGFSVVAVHDGEQAIEKVRESDFDVVLLDLILPKVDGLSALATIRSLDRDLPVIVMTACESPEALETARSHGVAGYINKPFDLDSLVEMVCATSSALNGRQNRHDVGNSVLFAKDQPITIEFLNGRTHESFPSRIEDRDEHTLTVLAPTNNGCVVDVAPRTSVRIGLSTNDAYYSFNSYVLATQLAEKAALIVGKPSVIYRTQRRQHTRYRVAVDVRLGIVDDENSLPESLSEAISCDISAGGIRVISAKRLEPGDLVYLETEGSDLFGRLIAVAEVLRSKESPSGDGFDAALRFRKLEGDLGMLNQGPSD